MGLLDGKRLLVTGVITDASIAFSVAKVAQEEGADVVLTGFGRMSLVERVSRKLPKPAPVVELDVTNAEHLARLPELVREHVDGIDGVLHSIGYAPPSCLGGNFLQAPWEDVSTAVQISTYSLASLAKASLPLFGESGGAILGLTFDATVAWPAYDWMGVAKAGLESTSRYLARELGPRGIRVNLVAAGPIRTMAAKSIPGFSAFEDAWDGTAPLGWDVNSAVPVARTCAALLSDWFPATTGEIVHVDGGFHAMGGLVTQPFDAFLLLGFGGPEGPDEVMPFLRQVTAGRNVPDERLVGVAEHYQHFGGVSPINDQNRALLSALEDEFAAAGIELPLYWGNRNWRPWLTDTVAEMAADGVARALVLATSATGGYSGCRQYRENLAAARIEVGASAPELVKVRHFFNHPGFIAANVDRVREALSGLSGGQADVARLVFTAHSIPSSADASAGPEGGLYSTQQRETARLIAEAVRGPGAEFDLVWQSRSGPPQVPWLGPDINDHLRALAAAGESVVIVIPSGFVSDHLEVLWDLDTEAQDTAAELGLTLVRAGTAGIHPSFVGAIRELVQERLDGTAKRSEGPMGPSWDQCPFDDGCCLPFAQRRVAEQVTA